MKNLLIALFMLFSLAAFAQPVRTTITDDGVNVTISTPVNTRVVPICDFHWTFVDGQLQMWIEGRNELIPGGRLGNFTINGATTQGTKLAALGAISGQCAGGGLDSLYLNGTLLANGDTITTSGLSDGDKGDITVSGSGATWTIDNSAVTSAKILDGTVANGDLASGVGGIYKGDGTAPTDVDIAVTDSINFDAGTLFINGTTDRVGIGVSTTLPSAQLSVRKDGIGVTQANTWGIVLANNTVAAAGAQQMSPGIRWMGNGWKTNATAASQPVDFLADILPIQGAANPTGDWQLKVSVNSGAYSNLFRARSNGIFLFGNASNRPQLIIANGFSSPLVDGTALQFSIDNSNARTTTGFDFLVNSADRAYTSGTVDVFRVTAPFSPTSGTGVFNNLTLNPTINQTGGSSGITRGIYVAPTLTAAADWRSVETSNNTGWAFYAAGTASSYSAGKYTFDVTNITAGTTGNQTINKPSGSVNFAADAKSLTVTNSFVTASSIIHCVVMTNDATAIIKNVVPASGSFVITLNAAATAETRVGFVVFN